MMHLNWNELDVTHYCTGQHNSGHLKIELIWKVFLYVDENKILQTEFL